jgi:hypothetical protein
VNVRDRERAETLAKEIGERVDQFEEEPHVNPNTQKWEFSIRDPRRILRDDQCFLSAPAKGTCEAEA